MTSSSDRGERMRKQSPIEQLDNDFYDFIEMLDKESKERGRKTADDCYKKVMAFGITLVAFYLRCMCFFLACGIGVLFASVLTGR